MMEGVPVSLSIRGSRSKTQPCRHCSVDPSVCQYLFNIDRHRRRIELLLRLRNPPTIPRIK